MKYMHKHEILPLIVIALALLVLSLFGCASVPITQASQQTDAVLHSDIVKPGHTITAAESRTLIKTLADDSVSLTDQQAVIIKQDKTIASGKFWRHFGIGAAILGVLICIGIITTMVIKGLRFFKIIP